MRARECLRSHGPGGGRAWAAFPADAAIVLTHAATLRCPDARAGAVSRPHLHPARRHKPGVSALHTPSYPAGTLMSHSWLLTVLALQKRPQPASQIIYIAFRKYSDPFTFFHVLLCCSLVLKLFEFIFFLSLIYTQYTMFTKQKHNFRHFCKKEKLKYHIDISIQTLCYDT